jgi:basic amino acid/polyamine antiporter, APA family
MNSIRHPELRRELGPFDAAALLIGCVLGSGIFVVPGEIAPGLPSAWLGLLLWLIGALLSVSGSICVARLAAAAPNAGGPYAYLRQSYGDRVGFMYGWTALVVVNCAVTAALAIAFSAAFNQLYPVAGERELAALTIAVSALIAMVGVKFGKHVQNALTVVKLLGAGLVICVIASRNAHPAHALQAWHSNASLSWQAIGGAMVGILWTYDGWTYLAFAGEEMRRAPRTLRFGFWVGSIIAALTVVLANVAYYVALSASEMSASRQPVALTAMAKYLGERGALGIEVVMLLAIFGSVNALFSTASRCPLAMARDGLLPSRLATVNARWGSPIVAIAVQAVGAMALVFHGSFIQVLSVSFVVDWTFKVLLIGSLLRHGKGPEQRASAGVWLPAAWCAIVAAILIVAAISDPRSAGLGLLLAALGLPLRWLWTRLSARRRVGDEHALRDIKLAP